MVELVYVEDLFRPDLVAQVDGVPALIGSACEICGDVRFPRAPGCPACHAAGDRLAPRVLARSGRLATCSRVERGPAGFAVPYLVGYVALDDGPRVLARIVAESLDPSALIGRRCSLEIGTLAETDHGPLKGYRFAVETS
jgi:uncharacterized OB-fold protein